MENEKLNVKVRVGETSQTKVIINVQGEIGVSIQSMYASKTAEITEFAKMIHGIVMPVSKTIRVTVVMIDGELKIRNRSVAGSYDDTAKLVAAGLFSIDTTPKPANTSDKFVLGTLEEPKEQPIHQQVIDKMESVAVPKCDTDKPSWRTRLTHFLRNCYIAFGGYYVPMYVFGHYGMDHAMAQILALICSAGVIASLGTKP